MPETFWLRYRTTEYPISSSEFIVGRAPECHLLLSDPLVSRRHASFFVRSGRLFVRDLNSRNGVTVQGRTIHGESALESDDLVVVGTHEFRVLSRSEPQRRAREYQTVENFEFPDDMTSTATPWSVVEGALLAKDYELARKLMSERFQKLATDIAAGKTGGAGLAEPTRYALRFAAETGESKWIDWVFNAHDRADALVSTATIDELHGVARKTHYRVSASLRAYVDRWSARAAELTPSERFTLQRLQGLLRTLLAT